MIYTTLSFAPELHGRKHLSNYPAVIWRKSKKRWKQNAPDIIFHRSLDYSRYGELVEVNHELAAVIASLQEHYPVVLISSAGSTRVLRDLEKLNGSIHFEQIFTKESFQKDRADDWIRLREMFHCDWILYFGNDPAEDIPPVTFVQTVLVAKRSGGPAL